jgi:hypothetical protein
MGMHFRFFPILSFEREQTLDCGLCAVFPAVVGTGKRSADHTDDQVIAYARKTWDWCMYEH